MERFGFEIRIAEQQLRAGNLDVEGLCLAIADWSAELRILEYMSRCNCRDMPSVTHSNILLLGLLFMLLGIVLGFGLFCLHLFPMYKAYSKENFVRPIIWSAGRKTGVAKCGR